MAILISRIITREKKMIDRYKNHTCNGCKACAEICPRQAIGFWIDKQGFWFPKVDYTKCSLCGLCVKKCPNKNTIDNNKFMPIVKAVWSKDDNVRMASTSGGLFYELARCILLQDGYVAGCVYDADFKGAHHVLVHSLDDLEPLMVSKYVESDTGGIYKEINAALKTGKRVMFVGSPCQCAGLESYLGKDLDNLIVVDFLCRGANSPKAHKKYIEYLEHRYNGKMTMLRSKDKRKGWRNFGQSAKFDNGKEYFALRNEDLRIIAYHHGNLMVRECCAECKFKTLPRYGDITLGDFWGINPEEVKDIDKGISLCFINSEKGRMLMDCIQNRIDSIDKTLNEAEQGNQAIYKSAPFSSKRNEFLNNLDLIPFDKLVYMYREKDQTRTRKMIRKFITHLSKNKEK